MEQQILGVFEMTTHITKTWFDGTNSVTQEIPVEEVYKREWLGLTDEEIKDCLGPEAVRIPPGWSKLTRAIEAKLKEKNT